MKAFQTKSWIFFMTASEYSRTEEKRWLSEWIHYISRSSEVISSLVWKLFKRKIFDIHYICKVYIQDISKSNSFFLQLHCPDIKHRETFFKPTAAENRPDYNAGGFSLSGQQHRTPIKTPPWNPPVAQPLRLAANKPGALAVTKGQLRQFPFSLNHLLFYDKVTNCGGEVTF